MRAFIVMAVVLLASCPAARAQDADACDKIALASKDGSIRRYGDAEIDRGLCVTSKLVWDAMMGANKAQEDRCVPATSAVMRELARRKRDPQQVRAKCGAPG